MDSTTPLQYGGHNSGEVITVYVPLRAFLCFRAATKQQRTVLAKANTPLTTQIECKSTGSSTSAQHPSHTARVLLQRTGKVWRDALQGAPMILCFCLFVCQDSASFCLLSNIEFIIFSLKFRVLTEPKVWYLYWFVSWTLLLWFSQSWSFGSRRIMKCHADKT